VCVKVSHYPERIYSPLRIKTPLRRVGKKGEGLFSPITWDEALGLVADRYEQISRSYGSEAILPYSYAGTMGVVQFHAGHAFFHRLGASRLKRTICSAAVEAGFAATLGRMPTTDIESAIHADLIIIWGSNTLSTNMHAWPFFLEARRRGAIIVVIDPYRNRTARQADLHIKLKPGTDAALALSMMKVLVDEKMTDEDFIREHTIGFEALKKRLSEYYPEKVESVTGVGASSIREVARLYGGAKAPYIRLGWGPGRQLRGGMAIRTIAVLPAIVGAFAKKGGGITRSTSAACELNLSSITREDLGPQGVREINMVELGKALTDLKDPPVMAMHVYHSNPAVVAPDSGMVKRGLAREDLFLVVQELLMTETALYADLVLPGASFLESTDLYRSYGHYYLQMARPVIGPVGESRTTLHIFQDLAARMGFTEECFRKREEDFIREMLETDSPYLKGITYEDLECGGPVRLRVPENPFAAGFKTPSGKVEIHSEAMAAQGLDPLPDGTPSVDVEGVGRYPLQLITPPRHQFLNSSFNEIDALREQAGSPSVMIHPFDARERGIEDGSTVRVWNDRGECFLRAEVTEGTSPGVTVIEGLYWPRFMEGKLGINSLTSQRLTDMGASCAFHCNLVEVSAVSRNR
jgi:anaerobic selenocysteine-containing dehydrogenase